MKSARRTGFTLVEVLLVLAIIGVIAVMVVPNLIGSQQRANIQATKIKIKSMETAVEMYATANAGEFPQGASEEVITMLSSATQDADGRTVPPYLTEYPRDPWQQVLFYEYPTSKPTNGKPAIWSAGPNKQNEDGGGDDVNNWVKL
jgi:general secretion pathway protein G